MNAVGFTGVCAIYGSYSSSSLEEVVRHYPMERVPGVLFMEYPGAHGEGQFVHPDRIKQILEEIDLEDNVDGTEK